MNKIVPIRDGEIVDVVPQSGRNLPHLGGRTTMERRVATRHAANLRGLDTKAEEVDTAMIRLAGLGARYLDIQRRLTNYGNDIAEAQERKDDYEYLAGVARAARELVSQGNQHLIAAYVKEAHAIIHRPAIEEDTRPFVKKLLFALEE
jgi:hypothetical protein